ncbi:MAG: DUF2760 domain-containing protein [Candidatus Rokuibacteriota bacterium]|nr:MAG: DUF2760 domain-containing protein [Candidatus Rokubacteria bacterium]
MIALASPWGLVLIVLALIGLAALAVVVVSGSRRRPAWRVLRDPAAADAVERMRSGAARARPAPPVAPAAVAAPARSEALSLLAVLQQEARLVDFLKEPLDGYTDAQVGAAVRDVHRDGATALERLFAIRPLRQEAEGSDVTVPAGFDAGAVRLTGRVTGAPPYRGTLRHPGWTTTKVELPRWTGEAGAARVIAPAEVEIP